MHQLFLHDFLSCKFSTKISCGMVDMTFVKAAGLLKINFGIPDIRSKISCGQVDMTFVKAVGQLKIVLGF